MNKESQLNLSSAAREFAKIDAEEWFDHEWKEGMNIPRGTEVPIDTNKYSQYINNKFFLTPYRQEWAVVATQLAEEAMRKPKRMHGAQKSPMDGNMPIPIRPPSQSPAIAPPPPQYSIEDLGDQTIAPLRPGGQQLMRPVHRIGMQIPDQEEPETKKGGLSSGKGKKSSPTVVDGTVSKKPGIKIQPQTETVSLGKIKIFTIALCILMLGVLIGGFWLQYYLLGFTGLIIQTAFSLCLMYLICGKAFWEREIKAHPFYLLFLIGSSLAIIAYLITTYGFLYKRVYWLFLDGFPLYGGMGFGLLIIAIGAIWLMKKVK